MSSNQNRFLYADILRIVAISAVIVLHLASDPWTLNPVNSESWFTLNIISSLVRWCVPVFVMLSGMLFLSPQKEISLKKLYQKNILRLITALVFWGIVLQVMDYTTEGTPFTANNIRLIFYKIIFGIPYYHLWYLYIIIGLYIITPPVRVFIANCTRKQLEYTLLLFLVFGLVEPLVNSLMSKVAQFPYSFSTIQELTGYLGYYIAGYYFSVYDLRKIVRKVVYIGSALSIVFTIVVTYFYSQYTGTADEFVYDNLLVNTAFTAVAVFIGIKSFFTNCILSEKTKRVITSMSVNTFGIYLIHVIFLNLLAEYNVEYFTCSFFITIPFFTVLAFFLSYFSTLLIREIPLMNKYII
jgi:surface polysaccharide O-acyltransferase-like enzyme